MTNYPIDYGKADQIIEDLEKEGREIDGFLDEFDDKLLEADEEFAANMLKCDEETVLAGEGIEEHEEEDDDY